MDDELDPFGRGGADLKEPAGGIGPDQHGAFVELKSVLEGVHYSSQIFIFMSCRTMCRLTMEVLK